MVAPALAMLNRRRSTTRGCEAVVQHVMQEARRRAECIVRCPSNDEMGSAAMAAIPVQRVADSEIQAYAQISNRTSKPLRSRCFTFRLN